MEQSNNNIRQRRRSIATLLGGAALVSWHKPILNSVVLPAHAQTSANMSISASSLDGDNPYSRYILIVDSTDTVLANCGASGGTASANNLNPGTYRIFADSDGLQNQVIDISTATSSQTVTVPTDTQRCNILVATVSLPSGSITPASGETISGPWACATNLGTGCL